MLKNGVDADGAFIADAAFISGRLSLQAATSGAITLSTQFCVGGREARAGNTGRERERNQERGETNKESATVGWLE